jgi:hypothetical protein
MTKHEDWRVGKDDHGYLVWVKGEDRAPDLTVVRDIHDLETARLIAAAPDLLAACELGGTHLFDTETIEGPQLLRVAAKAIETIGGEGRLRTGLVAALRAKAAAMNAALQRARGGA